MKSIRIQAEDLRKSGKSYSQISNSLNIPKSTLSGWFSKIIWSNDIKQKLISIQRAKGGNLKAANEERARRTMLNHLEIKNIAKREYQILKNDHLFLIGLSIYWGEGEKTKSGRVSIINTDPDMVLLMVNFYKKCLKISDDKLRVGLFIYDDLDQNEVTLYWSRYLNIPQNQFIKTQILKSRSRLTHRKSKYGVCSLYFSNTALSIKIGEWIRLMSQENVK